MSTVWTTSWSRWPIPFSWGIEKKAKVVLIKVVDIIAPDEAADSAVLKC
jgi:hypothetical protein